MSKLNIEKLNKLIELYHESTKLSKSTQPLRVFELVAVFNQFNRVISKTTPVLREHYRIKHSVTNSFYKLRMGYLEESDVNFDKILRIAISPYPHTSLFKIAMKATRSSMSKDIAMWGNAVSELWDLDVPFIRNNSQLRDLYHREKQVVTNVIIRELNLSPADTNMDIFKNGVEKLDYFELPFSTMWLLMSEDIEPSELIQQLDAELLERRKNMNLKRIIS